MGAFVSEHPRAYTSATWATLNSVQFFLPSRLPHSRKKPPSCTFALPRYGTRRAAYGNIFTPASAPSERVGMLPKRSACASGHPCAPTRAIWPTLENFWCSTLVLGEACRFTVEIRQETARRAATIFHPCISPVEKRRQTLADRRVRLGASPRIYQRDLGDFEQRLVFSPQKAPS